VPGRGTVLLARGWAEVASSALRGAAMVPRGLWSRFCFILVTCLPPGQEHRTALGRRSSGCRGGPMLWSCAHMGFPELACHVH